MKKLLTLLILTISFSSFAQRRSYVQIGAASYLSTKGASSFFGGGLGAGSSRGVAGAGIGIELVSQGKQTILPVYADMRCYFSPKKRSFYATLQPGYHFKNTAGSKVDHITIKDKGGIYAGIGIGLFAFDKKSPGVNFQLKYVFMQDKVRKTVEGSPDGSFISSTHGGFVGLNVAVVL
ncbi:MAG: hypothetical protein ABI402_14845 [Ferruginibacter sp.]